MDELEAKKKNLQEELYQEELDHPIVSEEQILHALYYYKSIDTSTKEGRQRLIDGFVNSIYLYDDKYVITFNYKNKSKTVTFEEIESSSLTSKGSPKIESNAKSVAFLFFAVPTERSNPWVRSLAVDGKPLANCVCLPLNKGRKPVGVTKQVKGEPVSFRRRIRLYHIL